MMTQFVPSLTSSAHFPAVAARIAVPAVSVSSGLTLDDAEITVNAARVLILTRRPTQDDAAGSVTVIEAPPLQMTSFSFAPRLNDVVLVTGATSPVRNPVILPISRSSVNDVIVAVPTTIE